MQAIHPHNSFTSRSPTESGPIHYNYLSLHGLATGPVPKNMLRRPVSMRGHHPQIRNKGCVGACPNSTPPASSNHSGCAAICCSIVCRSRTLRSSGVARRSAGSVSLRRSRSRSCSPSRWFLHAHDFSVFPSTDVSNERSATRLALTQQDCSTAPITRSLLGQLVASSGCNLCQLCPVNWAPSRLFLRRCSLHASITMGVGGGPHIGAGFIDDLPLWKEVAFASSVRHYTWSKRKVFFHSLGALKVAVITIFIATSGTFTFLVPLLREPYALPSTS